MTTKADEQEIMERLTAFAKHPRKRRRGYRLAHAELRRDLVKAGKKINHKRVYRLWRQAGLCVPARRRRKRIRSGKPGRELVADRPIAVWCFDFVEEKTIHRQKLRILCVSDEFTRESLAIEVGAHFVSEKVVATLEQLLLQRGTPGRFGWTTGRSSSPWRYVVFVIVGASIPPTLIRVSPGRTALPRVFTRAFEMSLWMGRCSLG